MTTRRDKTGGAAALRASVDIGDHSTSLSPTLSEIKKTLLSLKQRLQGARSHLDKSAQSSPGIHLDWGANCSWDDDQVEGR